MRSSNRRLLLHLLQVAGPMSQAELARRTRLSPASVSGILQPLIREGLLVPEAGSQEGAGRKAALLRYSSKQALVFGVVIEQDGCEAGLVDLSGQVISQRAASYAAYSPPHQVAEAVAGLLSPVLDDAGVTISAVVGAGVSVPGVIRYPTGDVRVSMHLGWRNVQFGRLIEDCLGLSGRVQVSARAKAQGESLWGLAKDEHSFVCLDIGAGLGAAATVDGKLLRGARNLAGEIGHHAADPNGPLCVCGQRGCLETVCSIPAVKRRLACYLKANPTAETSLKPESSIREIGAAALAGDKAACAVVRQTAEYVALAMLHVFCSYDPALIILSGRLIDACPTLVAEAETVFHRVTAVDEIEPAVTIAGQPRCAGVAAAAADLCLQYLDRVGRGRAGGAE